MKETFLKAADSLLARILPEITAAGCCPPDYHFCCLSGGPCTAYGYPATGWEIHYTCNCTEVLEFNGTCCSRATC